MRRESRAASVAAGKSTKLHWPPVLALRADADVCLAGRKENEVENAATTKYPTLEAILALQNLPLQRRYTNRDVAKIFQVCVRAIQNWITGDDLRRAIFRAAGSSSHRTSRNSSRPAKRGGDEPPWSGVQLPNSVRSDAHRFGISARKSGIACRFPVRNRRSELFAVIC